jgi:osmotically-inducible protein OsmY
MLRIVKNLVLISIVLTIVACSASPGSESTGEFIDSSTSTAKIKAQLIDNLGAKAFAIQVKTFKDEVQLSGFVNSQYVKKRAGTIAANNPDIKRVRNDLIVK